MKALDFSGSFVACDLKVGTYIQLFDLMKSYEYSRSIHLLTLAKGHLHTVFVLISAQCA